MPDISSKVTVFFLPGYVIPRQAFGNPAPELEHTYYCKPCGDWVRLTRQNRWLCCPRCGDKKMTDGSTRLTGAGNR